MRRTIGVIAVLGAGALIATAIIFDYLRRPPAPVPAEANTPATVLPASSPPVQQASLPAIIVTADAWPAEPEGSPPVRTRIHRHHARHVRVVPAPVPEPALACCWLNEVFGLDRPAASPRHRPVRHHVRNVSK